MPLPSGNLVGLPVAKVPTLDVGQFGIRDGGIEPFEHLDRGRHSPSAE